MSLLNALLENTKSDPDFSTLKKKRSSLGTAERAEVRRSGVGDDDVSRVWKCKHEGEIWYACHNHRVCFYDKSLKKVCSALIKTILPAD